MALADSGVRLLVTLALLTASVRWHQPLLLIPTFAVFLVVLRPVARGMGGVTSAPRWPRRRTHGATTSAAPEVTRSMAKRGSWRERSLRVSRQVDSRHAIVVGCDGDPATDGALRFAALESLRRQAKLIVVATYFKPIDPDLDDYDTPESELQRRAHDAAHDALRRALDLTTAVLPPHEIVTTQGPPAKVLMNGFADADLIVLGNHQRRPMSRLLHSPSTSADLIHHAHVPVVVVPPNWKASAG